MYLLKVFIYAAIVSLAVAFSLPKSKVLTNFDEFISDIKSLSERQYTNAANKYVDEYFLKDLNNYIKNNNFDPVYLKSFTIAANYMGITGEINLSNGWIDGFSTLKRIKNVNVEHYYPNLVLTIPLTFETIKGKFDYNGKVGVFELIGITSGTCINTNINLELKIDVEEYDINVGRNVIVNVGILNVNFSGNYGGGNIPNILLDTYLPSVKDAIKSIISEKVIESLKNLVEEHNDNVCEFTNDC